MQCGTAMIQNVVGGLKHGVCRRAKSGFVSWFSHHGALRLLEFHATYHSSSHSR